MKYTREKIWRESERFYEGVFSNLEPGIIIHNGQPGSGKTYSLSQAISENDDIKIAIFSANHKHLDKIHSQLIDMGVADDEIIHGKGFSKACRRFPPEELKSTRMNSDQRYVKRIYSKFSTGSLLCQNCQFISNCEHYKYKHNAQDYRITLQPLEYLFSGLNSDKDIFVVDEALLKIDKIIWPYASEKLHSFIQIIKENIDEDSEFNLDEYEESFRKIHKDLLRNCSIIFNEKEPSKIFDLMIESSSTSDFNEYNLNQIIIKEYATYITHPGNINLFDDFDFQDDFNKIYFLNSDFENTAFEVIKAIFESNDRQLLSELIKNYMPLKNLLNFIRHLGNSLPQNFDDKRWCLVHEKLENINVDDLPSNRENIIEDNDYERGFIRDFPYILDKRRNRAIISKMGKTYENKKNDLSKTKNSWLSFGVPYLHSCMTIARRKPVVLLDATFRDVIFEKITTIWWHKGIVHHGAHRIDIIFRKFRATKESNLGLENQNSVVYDVTNPISGHGHFPLRTLRNSSWIKDISSFIQFMIIEKNLEDVGIICHKEFQERFEIQFPHATVLHHFSQRGEDIKADFLIVIATPFRPYPSEIFDYILLFNEFPKSIDKIENGRFKGYKDSLLNEIFGANVTDEVYQELHRTRMLLYDRSIYAFCDVPEEIKKEVTVETMNNFTSHKYFAIRKILAVIKEKEPIPRTNLHSRVKNLTVFKTNSFDVIIDKLLESETIEELRKTTKTRPEKLYKLTEYGRDYLEAINRDITL